MKTTGFAEDTLIGLSSESKYLLSKYFYDESGSRIFEEIMRMPEYYLTDCELEIFENYKIDLADQFFSPNKGFQLIELGAGDGLKTKVLLSHLFKNGVDFTYIPIDISRESMEKLKQDIHKRLPGLDVQEQIGDYLDLIPLLNGSIPKIVLFLGSNIGNFSYEESLTFLRQLRSILNAEDKLLIGFDLKKDPEIILRAYNDPYGLTAAFNLNLLSRINDELDADFNTDNFIHQEVYDPYTGIAESYLISTKDQQVHILDLDRTIHLQENERIYMEMSQKYDETMIETLAGNSGFRIINNYYDKRSWFVDSLWGLNSSRDFNNHSDPYQK